MSPNKHIPSALSIVADFDHDGLIDDQEQAHDPSNEYAIALPISSIPEDYDDWRLMGNVHPLEVGTVKVRRNHHVPMATRIVIRTKGSWRNRVMLFTRNKGTWSFLGLKEEWGLAWDEWAEDSVVTLAVVVAAPSSSIASKDIVPHERGFDLEVIAFAYDVSLPSANTVRFVVCPFLLASALDPVEQVLVVENSMTAPVVSQLDQIVAQAGAQLRTIHFDESAEDDLWVQDTAEFGRFCVPSQAGDAQAVGVLTGIRARHEDIDCELLDRNMRDYFGQLDAILLDVATRRAGVRWIDWYGNLEVSPPITLPGGKNFPYGRILVGRQNDLEMHSDILAFLEAQQLQTPPIVVDTSWLLIGHVDEVVNFVPASQSPGFQALIPSPLFAKTILEALVSKGLGHLRVFANHGSDELSVIELLEGTACSPENIEIQRALQETQEQLCENLGVEIDDFVKIPVLFKEGSAVIPNGVNCLVCNGNVIFPDPSGPISNGQDAFLAPTQAAFKDLGLALHIIDIWEPYHIRSGEIHCGTNTIRRIRSSAWWNLR